MTYWVAFSSVISMENVIMFCSGVLLLHKYFLKLISTVQDLHGKFRNAFRVICQNELLLSVPQFNLLHISAHAELNLVISTWPCSFHVH